MKQSAPSAVRNREPILAVLRERLAPSGLLLEIASGTGEHAVHMAAALPGWQWQPSEADPTMVPSIDAWRLESGLVNVHPARVVDVSAPGWTHAFTHGFDALFCANMIHIAPWSAAQGLFAGAAQLLRAGGCMFTYGPYRFSGEFTAPSNQAFDQSLRQRNPAWGVRDIDDLTALAGSHGLTLSERVAMPANNHVLVWRAA